MRRRMITTASSSATSATKPSPPRVRRGSSRTSTTASSPGPATKCWSRCPSRRSAAPRRRRCRWPRPSRARGAGSPPPTRSSSSLGRACRGTADCRTFEAEMGGTRWVKKATTARSPWTRSATNRAASTLTSRGSWRAPCCARSAAANRTRATLSSKKRLGGMGASCSLRTSTVTLPRPVSIKNGCSRRTARRIACSARRTNGTRPRHARAPGRCPTPTRRRSSRPRLCRGAAHATASRGQTSRTSRTKTRTSTRP
mmetsp:Transcript_29797/g.100348  ORF Transcript_29797/g.100348 Transcript_29797/m.100348 type:complete len:256 (+) Transcript_29797:133-900(+)